MCAFSNGSWESDKNPQHNGLIIIKYYNNIEGIVTNCQAYFFKVA